MLLKGTALNLIPPSPQSTSMLLLPSDLFILFIIIEQFNQYKLEFKHMYIWIMHTNTHQEIEDHC